MSVAHVDVWWMHVSEAGDGLRRLLPDSEVARLERHRLQGDYVRGLTAAAMSRVALGTRLRVTPRSVMITRKCRVCGCANGKPHVPDQAAPDFSVSHADDVVLLAMAERGAVGIDLERHDAGCVGDRLFALTSTKGEANDSVDDFLCRWVRKEAVVKAVGTGLSTPLNRFAVTARTEPARLLTWPDDPSVVRRTQMADIVEWSDYHASLAHIAPPVGEPTSRLTLALHPGRQLLSTHLGG